VSKARVPQHQIIEMALREDLQSAKTGDPVSSEYELSQRFGVSRMTARQALKTLENDGLVYRVPGSGTFATGGSARRKMGELRSFSEEMKSRGIDVSSEVVSFVEVDPDATVRSDLKLSESTKALELLRVRFGNGQPMAIEKATIHPRLAFLRDYDLALSSMHQILIDHDVVPTEAWGVLVATSADPFDSELLRIPPGYPLLVERRRVVDQFGQPIESTETRYSGSKYVFEVNLRR
jgi:GntR family transcriptional regulator